AQVLVERFQRAPVLAKGIMGESCPPQTIIWSVPSIRVKTAECAARAVGASTVEIGDQLSARTTDPVINKTKHNSIRRITIKNLPRRVGSGYRKEKALVKAKRAVALMSVISRCAQPGPAIWPLGWWL